MKNGFTLIELLIVVAIIAILTAIAVPSYTGYVQQSNRTAAINGLLDLASREARYYTTNNAYSSSMTTLGYTADPMPLTNSGSTSYNLSVQSADTLTFTLQAVPVNTQASDTCGTFAYTNLGVKAVSASTVSDCWKQ